MRKKYSIVMVIIGILLMLVFMGFAIWRATAATPSFGSDGFILRALGTEPQRLSFRRGDSYSTTITGAVSFQTTQGQKVTISRESFAHMDNESIIALSDGILLDFNDLSENFINNYYIPAGLAIARGASDYSAETTAGVMEFGEHIWKLSDSMYILQAPALTVHFGRGESYEAGKFVQISVSRDGVYHIQSEDSVWTTISPDCYIQTQGGVKVYPVSLLVDDGTYKLSMAKLAVNTDDAIVLTEDETRRQIVPQLNITAVDGEDGIDGMQGADGDGGEGGANGVGGDPGTQGGKGNPGNPGSNAGDNSVKSAIPTMTVTDWRVSGDQLQATVLAKDEGGMLSLDGVLDPDEKYPAQITVTEVSTGRVISCYLLDSNGDPDPDSKDKISFRTGNDTAVEFITEKGALKPDTEYNLSVKAYYKALDSDLIFFREFISRNFVTDTVGVSVSYEKATVDSITVSTAISSDASGTATLYLLTPQQNKTFSLSSLDDAAQFTAFASIENLQNRQGQNVSTTFRPLEGTNPVLKPNTNYVVRVMVKRGDLEVITEQHLQVKTLKENPTTPTGAKPTLVYDRSTGAFQAWRPKVQDPNGGEVSYTYRMYKVNTTPNGSDTLEVTRTITPSEKEPVEFYLPTRETYYVTVELEFDDNEKRTTYDLGRSDPVYAVGASLPLLVLTPEHTEYNEFTGKLYIDLKGAKLQISPSSPLTLHFRSDQILNYQVTLDNGDRKTVNLNGKDDDQGTVSLVTDSNQPGEQVISIDLENLYKNTTYSVTVYGYVDLDDEDNEQEYTNRALGTVSFSTFDLVNSKAKWRLATAEDNIPNLSSYAFAYFLDIDLYSGQTNAEGEDARADHAALALAEGQTIISLYRGEDATGTALGTYLIEDKDELEALYSTGLLITNNDFGFNSSDLVATNYSCRITTIQDGTYDMDLGYVNLYGVPETSAFSIVAKPTPPDLTEIPYEAVVATPIYNRDAANFGQAYNENLDDEAVIGYTLEAQYNNLQFLARKVTYYAFELNTLYGALSTNVDPVKEAWEAQRSDEQSSPALMTMTLPVSTENMPKVAVIFGGTKTTGVGTYVDGYYRYFTGPVSAGNDGDLTAGMGRGYRYIFAYTVEYSTDIDATEAEYELYPYDHDDFVPFSSQYGGLHIADSDGTTKRVLTDKNPPYMLYSGIQEAPKVLPTFYTYVYKSAVETQFTATTTNALGQLWMHYKWKDPDGLIQSETNSSRDTQIYFRDHSKNEDTNVNIKGTRTLDNGWYELNLYYPASQTTATTLEPTVNISGYSFSYNKMFETLQLIRRDSERLPLTKIPTEWPYESDWNANKPVLLVEINATPEIQALNHIRFELKSSADRTEVLRRALGIRLTIHPKSDPSEEYVYSMPITYDAGSYFARMPSAVLAKHVGKDLILKKMELFYDSGLQGWMYAEGAANSGSFTMQYTNSPEDTAVFRLSDYDSADKSSQLFSPANGALWSKNGTLSNISVLQNAVATETAVRIYGYSLVDGSSYSNFHYPTGNGVAVGGKSDVASLSERYIVPKKIGVLDITPANEQERTFKLNHTTPAIQAGGAYTSTQSTINAELKNLTVNGLGEKGGTVFMAFYGKNQYQDAYQLTGTPRLVLTLPIGADGKVKIDELDASYNVGTDGIYQITELEHSSTYYVTFYHKQGSTDTPLLNQDKDETRAVFNWSTRSPSNVTDIKVEYGNESYYWKEYKINFDIDYTFGQECRYDLYSNADCLGTPLIEHEALIATGGLLTVPERLYTEMTLVLNLSPRKERELLVPGQTYYLRILVGEEGSLKVTDTPEKVQKATIEIPPTTATYRPNFHINDVTLDDNNKPLIDYQVTVVDYQNTLMGAIDSDNGKNTGGLFAVRFTTTYKDGDTWVEKRIWTEYDTMVFDQRTSKQNFELSRATFNDTKATMTYHKEMKLEQSYTIHIFAIPDPLHVGETEVGGMTLTPTQFGEKLGGFVSASGSLSTWGANFNTLIDSFWTAQGDPVAAQETLRSGLEIGSRSQMTLDDNGHLFREENVSAAREGNTSMVRIELRNSYKLIDANKNSVFEKILVQVEGETVDGEAIFFLEELDSEPLLTQGTDLVGNPVYYFRIPNSMPRGIYTIVIHFYYPDNTHKASTIEGISI